MKRILLAALATTLINCAAIKTEPNEITVFVGLLDWVKLYPNTTLRDYQPKESEVGELEDIVISNSCGSAEAQYSVLEKGKKIAWMVMGEWCQNPFKESLHPQLVVIKSDGEILEYYPIEEDNSGEAVVFLIDGWEYSNSQLRDLMKELDTPVLYSEIDESNRGWAAHMQEAGLLEIKDNEIFIKKAVYLDDIAGKYNL